jgi:alkylation response protein AidB-like acyl-CoA dehydrogenase
VGHLAFGQRGVAAVGWRDGDTHSGIAQMFGIVLYARLMVGIKSIATLSSGDLNALEFAKIRVQGPDLTRMSDKTAPRVRIISHPNSDAGLRLSSGGTRWR